MHSRSISGKHGWYYRRSIVFDIIKVRANKVVRNNHPVPLI